MAFCIHYIFDVITLTFEQISPGKNFAQFFKDLFLNKIKNEKLEKYEKIDTTFMYKGAVND